MAIASGSIGQDLVNQGFGERHALLSAAGSDHDLLVQRPLEDRREAGILARAALGIASLARPKPGVPRRSAIADLVRDARWHLFLRGHGPTPMSARLEDGRSTDPSGSIAYGSQGRVICRSFSKGDNRMG